MEYGEGEGSVNGGWRIRKFEKWRLKKNWIAVTVTVVEGEDWRFGYGVWSFVKVVDEWRLKKKNLEAVEDWFI